METGSRGSIVALLDRAATERPEAIGYTFLGPGEEAEDLRFGELRRRALARAAAIVAADLDGRSVVLALPSGREYLEGFFACLFAGVTPISGHVPEFGRRRAATEAVVRMARAADAGAALATGRLAELGRELAPGLTWIESEDAAAAGVAIEPRVPPRVAYVQGTSGSTGVQRGVELTDANLLANLAVQEAVYPLVDVDVSVSWLPMSHDMGFVGPLLQPLYSGGRTVLLGPLRFVMEPSRWLDAITRYRAGISGCPNFGYDLVLRRVSFSQREQLDLSSWRCAISGGEPIRPETLERFARAFAPAGFDAASFSAGYGLAEATSVVTASPPRGAGAWRSFDREALGDGRAELASGAGGRRLVGHGWAAAGHDVAIVDPVDRQRLPAGRVGEIWVRGPGVSDRYAGDHDEHEQVFGATLADGDGPYLRTGDLGFAFDDELFVSGRSKELILVRGVNHAPQDIEQTVREVDPILDGERCAVAQLADEPEPRVLVAIETAASAEAAELEDLGERIRAAVIERHGVAVTDLAVLPVGAIPVTTSGKIRRREVGDRYRAGELDTQALRLISFTVELQG